MEGLGGGGSGVEGAEEGDVGVAFFLGGGEAGLEMGEEEVCALGADGVVDVGLGGEDFEEVGCGGHLVG